MLAGPTGRDRLLDDLDCLVERDCVDPAAEDCRPQLVTPLEVLLAYPLDDCFPQCLSPRCLTVRPLPTLRMLGRKRLCDDPRPASPRLPNGEETGGRHLAADGHQALGQAEDALAMDLRIREELTQVAGAQEIDLFPLALGRQPREKRLLSAFWTRRGKNWKSGNW